MGLKFLDNLKQIKTDNNKKGLSTRDFYTELLFSKLGGGNIDKPGEDVIIKEGFFYYSTNKIFTKDKVKKVFFIGELPMEIESSFLEKIKIDLVRLGEVNIIKQIKPYHLDLTSFKIKNRIEIWRKKTEEFQKIAGTRNFSDDLFMEEEQKELDNRTKRMIKSWKWIFDSKNNKDEFCKYRCIIELIAENVNILYEMENVLVDNFRLMEISYNTVFVQTNEYYKTISPVGNVRNNMLDKVNMYNIYSDRLVSEMFNVPYGLVGDRTGVYFGTDLFTLVPVTYDLKKGSDAINFIITAKTSEGKSNYVKGLITYFELEGLSYIISDYEGDEYLDIGAAFGAHIIKMDSFESYYFDTLEIGDLTGIAQIDAGLKDEAIYTTKLIFDVLADYENGMNFHEVSLFSKMVNRVYRKRGVGEEQSTWKNSKGVSFKDLYKELLIMRNEKEFEDRKEYIIDFIEKLEIYFDEDGIYKNMFKRKISVNELLDKRRIIFSFGMSGKTENTIDKRSLTLKQLFVGYLIMLVSNHNKSVENKLTVVVMEEIQRYLGHEKSGKIVKDIITGGRKRGMITFLVTNSPLELMDVMDSTDSSEIASEAKAIKNNIQGMIIGKLEDETSERVCKSFGIPECLPELKLINKNEENLFKYSFLVNYRGESSLVKFEIPKTLQGSTMYVTRRDQED